MLSSLITLATLASAVAGAPCVLQARNGSAFEYIFAFGDSYTQTGFDITLAPPSAQNPIGNPPLPGFTTSGGPNWLITLLTSRTPNILTYNFASGGATTNASLVTPFAPTVLSLTDQVALFNTHLNPGGSSPSPAASAWTSSNSLFAIWIGVNDVGNGWYTSSWATTLPAALMAAYTAQLESLFAAGARNFLALTVPPIQRTPMMLTNDAYARDSVTQAVAKYNALLTDAVAKFAASKGDEVRTWVVDSTPAFERVLNDPAAYGAPDATCFNEDGVSCLWFNDYHPGQAIQRLVGEAAAAALEI
ncbi:uncharacterized protein L3040_005350 [Drepanopeziza brunnea f. sp. 'multigermtubi']|uniref:GDSL-like Lipase/Acylhydrolase n=1 Tax=Marssonina brunnea f. sp. multigermtubi (strain MB_m1) TaxID=1072389 RepID=K1WVX6_MARBU|nr:GDSL-like Lipase/Acylhydrolase [Drepanopeziza brunnea f. sp. 'multigermtubi' MB_m1]EKD17131.1 GDSL-like Lipase/Acylhydrolase [Drepanopeziza brunnea f. sp. 'multigermtubi' MB_m1]KAJ5041782.1 hypothetical protein L3040_005350 [Drepanopeziza brunnea f. sp. 'multigermtubi']